MLILISFYYSLNADGDGTGEVKRHSKTAHAFHPVLPDVGSMSDASRAITAPSVRYAW